ncbi:MAG TPA: hypothetical protein VN777_03310 [Terriglobales bacterium]|nr:hypothetical protein [Terriglobales bacterium]
MTSYDEISLSEVCTRVKNLGYAPSKRIRIYGEEFDIVSDPFPHDGGLAIHVRTREESGIRLVRLPAMLVRAAAVKEQRFLRAA